MTFIAAADYKDTLVDTILNTIKANIATDYFQKYFYGVEV